MNEEPQTSWPQSGAKGAGAEWRRREAVGTADFLARHARRVRGTPLAWSLVAVLTALALTGAAKLGWMPRGEDVAAVALAATAVLLGLWMRRVRRMNARELAHDLDERWALRARLESSVELAAVETAAARAQREDASRQVAKREPPGAWAWLGAIAWALAVAAILLVEGSVLGWRGVQEWRRASAAEPLAAAVAGPATGGREEAGPRDASAGAHGQASIEWISPEPEIKATSIEEVPLHAKVTTEHGVRAASLDVVVNGARSVSRSLEAEELGAVNQPGTQELRPSLFLDELGLKPFDLVSYRLVVELAEPAGVTASSALQFVQIRPVRRDVALKGSSSELAALLTQLKAVQLGLLKQNFELARMKAAEREASWAAENTRVADEQATLVEAAERGIGMAREAKAPLLVTENLDEARERMGRASKDIAARENARAASHQERALALLTELQQFIQPALEGGMAVSDPFSDREVFELPVREDSPAGLVEALAERQRKNNARIAAGGGTEAKDEQEAIARALGNLQRSPDIEADVQALLRKAEASAGEAAAQLGANDVAAARVPAAAAERALDQALAAQEKIGRTAAFAELARLRKQLNAANRSEDAAERKEKLKAWRTALRELAIAQQRSGSGHVARELASLDRRAGEAPALLAAAAAQTQVLLMPRGAALNRAIRPLQRVSGELTRNAADGEALVEMEMASQEAEWLTSDAPISELARRVSGQADGLLRARRVEPAEAQAAGTTARELALALERGTAAEREGGAKLFNPAEIDPHYRAAVETYFERLSREGRAPQKAKAP